MQKKFIKIILFLGVVISYQLKLFANPELQKSRDMQSVVFTNDLPDAASEIIKLFAFSSSKRSGLGVGEVDLDDISISESDLPFSVSIRDSNHEESKGVKVNSDEFVKPGKCQIRITGSMGKLLDCLNKWKIFENDQIKSIFNKINKNSPMTMGLCSFLGVIIGAYEVNKSSDEDTKKFQRCLSFYRRCVDWFDTKLSIIIQIDNVESFRESYLGEKNSNVSFSAIVERLLIDYDASLSNEDKNNELVDSDGKTLLKSNIPSSEILYNKDLFKPEICIHIK